MIDSFRQGNFSTLIATNVLARGIDVPEVDLVVNFDVPKTKRFQFEDIDYANYLHRVGRTGRFGTDGVALTMMSEEHDEEHMQLLAKHYEITIEEIKDFGKLISVVEELRAKQQD